MSDLNNRLVCVNEGAPPAAGGALMMLPPGALDDQTLLECMVDTRSDMTLSEALNSVIAEQFLKAGFVNDGPRLVIVLAGIVRRYMRRAVNDEVAFQDQYLYDLAGALRGTNRPVERISKGIELGDRAIHLASGWIGSRDMVRRWSSSDLQGYGQNMAIVGYGTVMDTVGKMGESGRSREMTSRVDAIEFLMNTQEFRARMAKVIAVLRSLRPQQENLEDAFERMGHSGMVLGNN